MTLFRCGLFVVAMFAAVFDVRATAAADDPCPGDELVWVSHDVIYDHAQAKRHQPGHDACFHKAIESGARPPKTKKAMNKSRRPASALPPQPVEGVPLDGAPGAISDSVYDVVDRRAHIERAGYGRYTYVLLTNANERERNRALLAGLLASTPGASTVAIDKAELNVFEIPETPTYFKAAADPTSADAMLATYDFGFAHDLLHKACKSKKAPRFCKGDLAGPFLLTYGRPLGSATVANPPYLVVDLHRFNAHGFDQMIALMKEQVKLADYPDGRLVEGFGVHLLSFILDVSDWLPGLTSDAKHIVDVVPTR